ncbi:MAG: helical backbone metal receptor [Candidatus Poseidoniales archaeon]
MRIVSLVPSLTLTLFDLGLDASSVVGRTPWCIHPTDGVASVPVVGGTKTPNLGKIKSAQPDVVVMDRDENPKAVYEWCLEQGYETFVCHVQHPRDVPDMLRALGRVVKRPSEAEVWATQIEDELTAVAVSNERVALPLIWHDPLMAANGTTYAGNMLACMGYTVPIIEPDGTGYPEVSVESLVQCGITDLFLSSEPHEFTTQEGEVLLNALRALTDNPPALHFIDGEDLTWMGTRTLAGLRRLNDGRPS